VSYLDFAKLDLMLRMIGHLERRLSSRTRAAFLTDIDEVDLTAFRLSVIGETSSKLSPELKSRHPHIDWIAIYNMRNVIVHDYDAVLPERLWAAFANGLDALAEVCRMELGGDVA
jgi:uncharacterized protein with HEPN domain